MDNINYKSLTDLNSDIINNLWKIPRETDLVVGIPRSGLLAANLIALHLNLPLLDFQSLTQRMPSFGGMRVSEKTKGFDQYKNILIVDDSLLSGKSMKNAKQFLEGMFEDKSITFMAIYVVEEHLDKVDLFMNVCPYPRVFEWNIMHHDFLNFSCMDIDGVLCLDPTSAENDDGEAYRFFLENAKPLFTPSVRVGCLVTNRLEKYRSETEKWLKKNNIGYDSLIMLDFPDMEKRKQIGLYAEFKAMVYIETEASLFIESSEWQAKEIAEISGKPVFCVDTKKMIY